MRQTLPLLALLLAVPAIAQEGQVLETPSLPERALLERTLPASSVSSAAVVSEPVLEIEAPDTNDGTVRSVFTVDQDGGLLAEGNLGIGTIPATGPGYRIGLSHNVGLVGPGQRLPER